MTDQTPAPEITQHQDDGRLAWSWRCPGAPGCLGERGLFHVTEESARNGYARHAARHHTEAAEPVYDRRAWETYRRTVRCGCTAPVPADCARQHLSGPWLCVCHRLSVVPTAAELAAAKAEFGEGLRLTVDTDAVEPEPSGEEHTHPPFETCDDCQRRAFPDSTGLDKPACTADLRRQYTEAIKAVAIRLKPDPILTSMLQVFAPFHLRDEEAEPVADAVMAVRDTELDELRNETAMQRGVIADYRVENAALRDKLAVRDTELEQARATVLREAVDVAREEGHRLEGAAGIEAARGARSVAYLLRRMLVKAQPIQPQPDAERAAPIDWEAIARRRERELKQVGEARHRAEAELTRRDAAESADAAAGSYAGRAEAAEAELARLRAGEEPYTDERVVLTPGQWIWKWNRLTPAQRLTRAAQIQWVMPIANDCYMLQHREHIDEVEASLARVRAARLCDDCRVNIRAALDGTQQPAQPPPVLDPDRIADGHAVDHDEPDLGPGAIWPPPLVPEPCDAAGPWGDAHACYHPAGHEGPHEAADGCNWRNAPEADRA